MGQMTGTRAQRAARRTGLAWLREHPKARPTLHDYHVAVRMPA